MTTLTESVYTGEFLVSEANNTLSREQVTLAPGLNLLSGTVLGRITDSDVYVPLDLLAADGSEQAAGVLYNNATTSSSGGDAVIIARQAEVDEQLLVWPAVITDEQQKVALAELATLGIVLR